MVSVLHLPLFFQAEGWGWFLIVHLCHVPGPWSPGGVQDIGGDSLCPCRPALSWLVYHMNVRGGMVVRG